MNKTRALEPTAALLGPPPRNWLAVRARLALEDWRRQHRERDQRTVLLVELMEHDA